MKSGGLASVSEGEGTTGGELGFRGGEPSGRSCTHERPSFQSDIAPSTTTERMQTSQRLNEYERSKKEHGASAEGL